MEVVQILHSFHNFPEYFFVGLLVCKLSIQFFLLHQQIQSQLVLVWKRKKSLNIMLFIVESLE